MLMGLRARRVPGSPYSNCVNIPSYRGGLRSFPPPVSRYTGDRATGLREETPQLRWAAYVTSYAIASDHGHWHRVADRKLVRCWVMRDDLGTLIQLGIIDPPGRFPAHSSD